MNIHSNLERIDKMTDSEIDYSDIPELKDDFFDESEVSLPILE